MKMICKKCGTKFESLIIDRELAWKEIYSASERHIKTNHNKMFVEMLSMVKIAATSLAASMHLEEFCIITEDEKELQEKLNQYKDVVMAAIGFDAEDVEEDEEFEDEDSIDNDPQVGTVEVVTEEDKEKVNANS